MNRLIWKELVEQRNVPVAYAAILACILVIWDIMGNWVAMHGGMPADRMNLEFAAIVLAWAIFFSGLFPGCNFVSAEAGQGTERFLLSLPVSSRRIWTSKLITGLIITVASAFLMVATFLVIAWFEFRVTPDGVVRSVGSFRSMLEGNWITGLAALTIGIYCMLFAYSIAVFSSGVTDRPVAAFGISVGIMLLVTAIAGYMTVYLISTCPVQALSNFQFFHSYQALEPTLDFFPLVVIPTVPGFILASFIAFCRSSSTTIRERRARGLLVISLWLVGLGALVGADGYLGTLAGQELPDLNYSTVPPNVGGAPGQRTISHSIDINYRRVEINKTYHWTVPIAGPKDYAGPLIPERLTTPEWNVNLFWKINHKPSDGQVDRYFWLDYTYTPKLPYGEETRSFPLTTTTGKTVGTITLHFRKAPGYFPPVQWFCQDWTKN